MKKIKNLFLASLVLMAIGVQQANAQVSIGLKGGLNFANINTSSVGAAYDSRTGYHVGAFALFKLTKFGIQPELIYSQQGSTIKINSTDFDSNFSYMNIPVILKFYVAGGFNIQVGPQFGFLMSATGPVFDGANYTSGDIKSYLKGSDISVGMGAGFDLPFKLTIDARYNLGVSEINNDASLTATKNQVFQLSVGYKLINLGK